MIEIYDFGDLPAASQHEVATYVSSYSVSDQGKQAKMAPVSFAQIMDSEEGLVALHEDVFAGYIRAHTAVADVGMTTYQQIGSLVVPALFRGQGIAKLLVSEARDETIGRWNIPYAFCSPASKPIYEYAGFAPALPGELPEAAVSMCGNAPMVYPMHKFLQLG